MKIPTEYEYKQTFLSKHGNDFKITTEPMDPDGTYRKIYQCADGATLWEVNSPKYEKAVAEAHGVKFDVEIKLMRTEIWHTDDATSKWFWSKW